MSNYIRARGGDTYFFTVVTWRRCPILCFDSCREVLREVVLDVRKRLPFEIMAWVLLPDHIHCIWKLPMGDFDYSKRWGMIKAGFTKGLKKMDDVFVMELLQKVRGSDQTTQIKRREGMVWQRRFWEHMIRDDRDYRNHCDYIHYNPVKHGLVESPTDWQFSTIHKFINSKIYSVDWAGIK